MHLLMRCPGHGWPCLLLGAFVLAVPSAVQSQPVTHAEFLHQRQLEIASKQRNMQQARSAPLLAKATPAQQNYDVIYYGLQLNIDPNAGRLTGTADIRARSLAESLAEVELDLFDNMRVDSVDGALSFAHSRNKLTVQLARATVAGEELQIRVHYQGRPLGGGFGGFVFGTQSGQPMVWTLSQPYLARCWWPCKDVPDDKPDAVDVVVTVPAGLTVASNGALRAVSDNGNGTTTFHWHESYPIATYLVSLAITNYATYSDWFRYGPNDSMEVQFYIFPRDLALARGPLSETVNMIRFFHDTIAPYPFLREKYGIAQFGWGGGMEHQTITSQGAFGRALTVHELAHQWWGDMITTASWADIWMNEGFASYAEALYFEHVEGREYYHQYMAWMAQDFPGSIYRRDTTSVSSLFNLIVYHKGAWVLHMLRHVLGEETFFALLRAYTEEPAFKFGNVSTERFRHFCEQFSGQDLQWFFTPWIYGTGRPYYRYHWQATDSAGGVYMRLHLTQAQYPRSTLFAMPIDLLVKTVRGDTTITVFCDQPEQEVSLRLHAQPIRVTLDPQNWILKRVEEISGGPLPVGDYALLQNHPNPFAGTTTVPFSMPRHERVQVQIYDLSGALVRTLVEGVYLAGGHSVVWDGRDGAGRTVSCGIYFCRMRAGGFESTRRLVLLRR